MSSAIIHEMHESSYIKNIMVLKFNVLLHLCLHFDGQVQLSPHFSSSCKLASLSSKYVSTESEAYTSGILCWTPVVVQELLWHITHACVYECVCVCLCCALMHAIIHIEACMYFTDPRAHVNVCMFPEFCKTSKHKATVFMLSHQAKILLHKLTLLLHRKPFLCWLVSLFWSWWSSPPMEANSVSKPDSSKDKAWEFTRR